MAESLEALSEQCGNYMTKVNQVLTALEAGTGDLSDPDYVRVQLRNLLGGHLRIGGIVWQLLELLKKAQSA